MRILSALAIQPHRPFCLSLPAASCLLNSWPPWGGMVQLQHAAYVFFCFVFFGMLQLTPLPSSILCIGCTGLLLAHMLRLPALCAPGPFRWVWRETRSPAGGFGVSGQQGDVRRNGMCRTDGCGSCCCPWGRPQLIGVCHAASIAHLGEFHGDIVFGFLHGCGWQTPLNWGLTYFVRTSVGNIHVSCYTTRNGKAGMLEVKCFTNLLKMLEVRVDAGRQLRVVAMEFLPNCLEFWKHHMQALLGKNL